MNKIIVKVTRLAASHDVDLVRDWVINNSEELYNFKRMRLPREGYTHCYVTVNIGDHRECCFVCQPNRLGVAVFNRVKDFVFSWFVHELFE